MRRRSFLGLIPFAAGAQTGLRDRYFARYPFDKWVETGDRSQIRWTVHIPGAQLSAHQRTASRIEVEIDQREVEKRRGRGEIVCFFEIEDSTGQRWRRHDLFNLAVIPPSAKAKTLFYVQDFFIQPGEYKITLAACDSHTNEYSLTRRTLRISPLRNDPLPGASADLPSVEMASRLGLPDSWFQPYAKGSLRLPIETTQPLRIELMMNLTLSERASGSLAAFRRNMGVLVPALKVLSRIHPSTGTLNITLFDLTKRRIWEQKDVRELDWEYLRAPFAQTSPGVIDAQSLAAKAEMTQYFWDQVLDRLRPSSGDTERRAVIVLSSPVFLAHQIKVEPAAVPKDPNRRVFYLRYRPTPRYQASASPPSADGTMLPAAVALPNDDLERTLKALDSKNFNAITALEFRKAVAGTIDAIHAWIE